MKSRRFRIADAMLLIAAIAIVLRLAQLGLVRPWLSLIIAWAPWLAIIIASIRESVLGRPQSDRPPEGD
jgi:hypothetical protein